MEFLIGIGAIVVSVILYYAGVRHGRRQDRERREHERQMAREQRKHELPLEAARQRRELISKVADEYVSMSRRRYDNGPHALASIGLEHLGSDQAISEAIEEMRVRAGEDPWAGHSQHVKGIDLVAFFRHAREKRSTSLTAPSRRSRPRSEHTEMAERDSPTPKQGDA
jgi:hypothetical protein